jgi:hypothetical protein
MTNRFSEAARALGALLVLGACDNATRVAATEGSAGSGDDTQCIGAIAGPHDNVVVPPDMVCNMFGAQVKGSVKALSNSILRINSSTIQGNVEGDKAFLVWLQIANTVGGNIQIKEGANAVVCGTTVPNGNIQLEKITQVAIVGAAAFDFGSCVVGNTVTKGNVKLEENSTALAEGIVVRDNMIGGNLQVFKNKGPGSKVVQFNNVGQNLQCFENDPPFVGGPNVAGKAEGQCF